MGSAEGFTSRRVKATYQKGIFLPETPCDLPEGAAVELIVQGPIMLPPSVSEPEERARILAARVERMRDNPIPPGAPPLNRESLHDRS